MPIRGMNWFAVPQAADQNVRSISEDSGDPESSDGLGDLVCPALSTNAPRRAKGGSANPGDRAGRRRSVSGRFVVESVQQQWLLGPYTQSSADTMRKPPQTAHTMSESQPGLKSILKNMTSISACHSSDDDVLTAVCPRRKRVSFSEIVTEQLYQSEQPRAEPNGKKPQKNKASHGFGKKKQKEQNKTKQTFGKKRCRNRQSSAEPYKQLKSQISDSIFELVKAYPMKTGNDHDSVIIENQWTEVTYRRPNRRQKVIKRQDSEVSDESGFGSLPSSLDESQGNSFSFAGFFGKTSSRSTGHTHHAEDKHQEVDLILNRLLDVAISEDAVFREKQ